MFNHGERITYDNKAFPKDAPCAAIYIAPDPLSKEGRHIVRIQRSDGRFGLNCVRAGSLRR